MEAAADADGRNLMSKFPVSVESIVDSLQNSLGEPFDFETREALIAGLKDNRRLACEAPMRCNVPAANKYDVMYAAELNKLDLGPLNRCDIPADALRHCPQKNLMVISSSWKRSINAVMGDNETPALSARMSAFPPIMKGTLLYNAQQDVLRASHFGLCMAAITGIGIGSNVHFVDRTAACPREWEDQHGFSPPPASIIKAGLGLHTECLLFEAPSVEDNPPSTLISHDLVEDGCSAAAAEFTQGAPEDCSDGHSRAQYTTVLYLGEGGRAEINAFLKLNPKWRRFFFSSETYRLLGMSETDAIYEDSGSWHLHINSNTFFDVAFNHVSFS